jgi:hypothetical protein
MPSGNEAVPRIYVEPVAPDGNRGSGVRRSRMLLETVGVVFFPAVTVRWIACICHVGKNAMIFPQKRKYWFPAFGKPGVQFWAFS